MNNFLILPNNENYLLFYSIPSLILFGIEIQFQESTKIFCFISFKRKPEVIMLALNKTKRKKKREKDPPMKTRMKKMILMKKKC